MVGEGVSSKETMSCILMDDGTRKPGMVTVTSSE